MKQNKLPMKDEKVQQVRIRILPGHGIGGIGYQNQVVTLNPSEAAFWVKEGYAAYVNSEEAVVVEPTAQGPETPESEG